MRFLTVFCRPPKSFPFWGTFSVKRKGSKHCTCLWLSLCSEHEPEIPDFCNPKPGQTGIGFPCLFGLKTEVVFVFQKCLIARLSTIQILTTTLPNRRIFPPFLAQNSAGPSQSGDYN
jgi:hypothetical protein